MNNSTSNSSASAAYACVFAKLEFRMDDIEYIFVSNVVLSVLNGTFALTAITGNLLVLLAIWLTHLKRSPSNVLISSLAFADFQVGFVVQPAFVMYKISEIYGYGPLACYGRFINVTFGYATTGVSLMTMTAIGLERYLALHLHLRYIEVITRQKIMIYCGASWGIAVGLVVIYFLERSIFGIIVVLAEVLSVVITSVAYFRVYKIVKRHQSDIQKQRRISVEAPGGMQLNIKKYQRSTSAMFLVFMLSFICYAPYPPIMVLLFKYGYTPNVKIAVEMSATIICINSTLNPLIYCLKLKEIRRAVMNLLKMHRPEVYPFDRSGMTFAPMSTIRNLHNREMALDIKRENVDHNLSACYQDCTSL